MELPDVPLFRGLTADEAEAAVTALRMRRRAFAKGETLLEAGQRAPALGVVLAGRVHMEHLDVWGSKTLLGQAGPGDLFAETYACLPDEPLRVSVVAAENGEALFLETGQLLQCVKIWGWRSAACTPPPRRSAGGSQRTFRCWRGKTAACGLRSPLTASSWPTTLVWTAAP